MTTALAVIAALLAGRAGEAAPGAPGAAPRALDAVRVALGAVTLDGRLDEAVWRAAPFATGFVQREPSEGEPATQETAVAILFDGAALHVGARMRSDGPVDTLFTRRDDLGATEHLVVTLDALHDRRTAHAFAVTAAGVRAEWHVYDDAADARDLSYDPVWEAATRVDGEGWSAELRIPLAALRFHRGFGQTWGLELARVVPSRNEEDQWALVPRTAAGWVSFFGELRGLAPEAAARPLEVVAGATISAERAGAPPPPLEREPTLGFRPSADARLRLAPALSLAATVNPDFVQVEADPASVNLTAFELELEERRPFFGETLPLLTGPGPQYFYSRRIGAVPPTAPDAPVIRLPRGAPVLAAAKLTGAPRRGTLLGALAALTGDADADVADVAGEPARRVRVAPLTGLAVLRLTRQLGPGASAVGAAATAVARDVGAGEEGAALLPERAVAGGLDFHLRSRSGVHALSGYAGGSAVAGSPAAILRVQESSAHTFQRPDQDHARLDPDARSLLGYTASLTAERIGGERWLWSVGGTLVSPGFELNDAGLLARADARAASASVRWRETRPGRLHHRWEASLRGDTSWTYGGEWQDAGATLDLAVTWPTFRTTHLFATARPRTESPTLTRGGPLMATGPDLTVGVGASDDAAVRLRWGFEAWWFADRLGARGGHLEARLTTRPTDRLVLSLAPTLDVSRGGRQYLDTVESEASPLGARWVFAVGDRVDAAVQLRGSYFATPSLGVEAFLQPLRARGRFGTLGELAAPGAAAIARYEPPFASVTRASDGSAVVSAGGETFEVPEPDFDVRSLRSTAVLRWEWRPGSTLHLVWQHERAWGTIAAPLGPDALGAPVERRPRTTIALKLAWWVPLAGGLGAR